MIIIELQYDKDAIKNNLTINQIADFVTSLGANPIEQNGVLMMETICHNDIGDSHKKKLYYYDNTKLFRCYTDCGDTFDVFELVCRVKKVQLQEDWSLPRALFYVANAFGLSTTSEVDTGSMSSASEDLRILSYYETLNKNRESIDVKYKVYDTTILKNLLFLPSKEWLKEGITIDTMKKFGIKYYGTDHKIVIPHYNYRNELIGIRGRALAQEDVDNYGKYMPLRINNTMYTHPLSYNLYGLNFNLENIQKAKRIILFEGEKSVMLYDSIFGSENNISVATCGSSVSLIQIDFIRNLCNVDEVVLAYDKQFQEIGDNEHKKDIKLLVTTANKINKYCTVSIMFDKFGLLDYKDSPIDKGKEKFEYLFANRIVQGV